MSSDTPVSSPDGELEKVDNSKTETENVENGESVPSAEQMFLSLPKHPLQHTWCLWYFENDKNMRWEDSQRKITSFNTVEDFWSVYMHLKPVSELKAGCDYSLFKEGIRPMWEDVYNNKGGRWLLSFEKRQRQCELDKYWMEIMLCMIGEAFEHSDEVNGAVCNIRGKCDKIAVWTSNAKNAEAVTEIGRLIKTTLNMAPDQKIHYEMHSDSMTKSGSSIKTTYCV